MFKSSKNSFFYFFVCCRLQVSFFKPLLVLCFLRSQEHRLFLESQNWVWKTFLCQVHHTKASLSLLTRLIHVVCVIQLQSESFRGQTEPREAFEMRVMKKAGHTLELDVPCFNFASTVLKNAMLFFTIISSSHRWTPRSLSQSNQWDCGCAICVWFLLHLSMFVVQPFKGRGDEQRSTLGAKQCVAYSFSFCLFQITCHFPAIRSDKWV